ASKHDPVLPCLRPGAQLRKGAADQTGRCDRMCGLSWNASLASDKVAARAIRPNLSPSTQFCIRSADGVLGHVQLMGEHSDWRKPNTRRDIALRYFAENCLNENPCRGLAG